MFQVPEIKVTDRSILTRGCKQILVPEADVEHGGIMSNQLSLHAVLVNVPDGARCVDGTRADYVRGVGVPVEARDRSAVVRVCLG